MRRYVLVIASIVATLIAPEVSSAAPGTTTTLSIGSGCTRSNSVVRCASTLAANGTLQVQFAVPAATAWEVGMRCSGGSPASGTLPDVWAVDNLIGNPTTPETLFVSTLSTPPGGGTSSPSGPFNNSLPYVGYLHQGEWGGTPIVIDTQFISSTTCTYVGSFIEGAGEFGNLASINTSVSTDHADIGQIHTDLTGNISVTCALCSKDSTLSGFQSANHTDQSALNNSVTGLNTTMAAFQGANHTDSGTLNTSVNAVSTAIGSSNTQLASFQTASHTDMSSFIELSGWIVGAILFLSISGILARTFWGSRDG